jgi:hypothetical protein
MALSRSGQEHRYISLSRLRPKFGKRSAILPHNFPMIYGSGKKSLIVQRIVRSRTILWNSRHSGELSSCPDFCAGQRLPIAFSFLEAGTRAKTHAI